MPLTNQAPQSSVERLRSPLELLGATWSRVLGKILRVIWLQANLTVAKHLTVTNHFMPLRNRLMNGITWLSIALIGYQF